MPGNTSYINMVFLFFIHQDFSHWERLSPCVEHVQHCRAIFSVNAWRVKSIVWSAYHFSQKLVVFCHGPIQACVEECIPFVRNTGRLPLDMTLVFALAVFVVGSGAQKLVAFDDATASSIYSSKSFAADLATAESSGCSF